MTTKQKHEFLLETSPLYKGYANRIKVLNNYLVKNESKDLSNIIIPHLIDKMYIDKLEGELQTDEYDKFIGMFKRKGAKIDPSYARTYQYYRK